MPAKSQTGAGVWGGSPSAEGGGEAAQSALAEVLPGINSTNLYRRFKPRPPDSIPTTAWCESNKFGMYLSSYQIQNQTHILYNLHYLTRIDTKNLVFTNENFDNICYLKSS